MRAVTEREKQDRKERILQVAREMFLGDEIKNIKIIDLAKKAGIAKGTVFLYFKTKEQIFLELAAQEYDKWFKSINKFLEKKMKEQKENSLEELADFFDEITRPDEILFRLIPLLHSVLEVNITFEEALKFKSKMGDYVIFTGRLLEKAYPVLEKGEGVRLLLKINGFIIGFKSMCAIPPVLKDVMATNPHLKVFVKDFKDYFISTIQVYLKGVVAQKAGIQ